MPFFLRLKIQYKKGRIGKEAEFAKSVLQIRQKWICLNFLQNFLKKGLLASTIGMNLSAEPKNRRSLFQHTENKKLLVFCEEKFLASAAAFLFVLRHNIQRFISVG